MGLTLGLRVGEGRAEAGFGGGVFGGEDEEGVGREIGGVGRAGEDGATYGSLSVGSDTGGTAKVCLTAHADAGGAPGAVSRR